MIKRFLILVLFSFTVSVYGQDAHYPPGKQRLDFAKTYFEFGARGYTSFTGKRISGNSISSFEHAHSLQPYLSWGGFHFWGHAEFFVELPLEQLRLKGSSNADFRLNHNVVTGVRLLPWVFQEQKVRPYFGASWASLEFSQTPQAESKQPSHFKDFRLVTDFGFLYGYKGFVLRAGLTYSPDNTWEYPLSRTVFEQIETPAFTAQLGLLYTFDSSRNEKPESIEKWNTYPRVSPLGSTASRAGDFFVGLGPSSSFSLSKSEYNQTVFPFLQDKISSSGYFDMAIGYQLNKAGLFAALSFRNPVFEAEGYEVRQKIQKNSLALEVNKHLFDYSGFAPYIGVNVAYDYIEYSEDDQGISRIASFEQLEPGITLGWDILPGKTEEYLILRTNIRWYPFSSFDIEGTTFNFSQLEYNLIQVVFYPGRLLNARK
ncbi:MAG: hypothetical protein KTR29_00560 [Rhodothermaceae bacterium]|nr:hypothetical protein [Rhodothermaceae bacterium]